MLRSTALLLLASTLALASPLLEPRGLNGNAEQVVMNGVSWGANKLSKIGTQDDGRVGTLTKWDWTDCGKSLNPLSVASERGSPISKVGEEQQTSLSAVSLDTKRRLQTLIILWYAGGRFTFGRTSNRFDQNLT